MADSGPNSIGTGISISLDGGTLAFFNTTSDTTTRNVLLNPGGGTIGSEDPEGSLTLSGIISGVGGLTKTGPGTLVLAGTTANTYAGTTISADGAFNLNKTAGVNAVGGDLTIGDGNGAAASAVLSQGNDEQIPDSTTVTIAADGFWNLASGNHSETIAALA